MNPSAGPKGAVGGILGEARGRLLVELCGNPQTVAALATKVGTSSNAVREHLDSLREAGLVEYSVARRGVGKPAHIYALTADAEYLLSKAYAPALVALVNTLRKKMNGQLAATLREAGEVLGRPGTQAATPKDGLRAARSLLESFGASTLVADGVDGQELRTTCCPLGAATRESLEVCAMMESALATASGSRVRERCARGAHPRCAFIFDTNPVPGD